MWLPGLTWKTILSVKKRPFPRKSCNKGKNKKKKKKEKNEEF